MIIIYFDIIMTDKGFLSKAAKAYFHTNWDKRVDYLAIGRSPVIKAVQELLNASTNGELKERLKKYGYTDLIHPNIIFILEDGTKKRFEREAQLIVRDELVQNQSEEWLIMDIKELSLTLGEMITNHLKFYKTDTYDKLISYSPINQNSQTFVRDFLRANGLLTSQMRSFFVQPLNKIMAGFKWTNEAVNKIVKLGFTLEVMKGNGEYSDSDSD